MLSHARFQAALAPMLSDLLQADAAALADVRAHRELFAGQDRTPVSAAAASARRSRVVTAMRQRCANYAGWSLDRELLSAGGYQWLVDDDAVVRISKTTREERAARTMRAFQPTLDAFPEADVPRTGRETILVRLDGKPLMDAWVTVALLKSGGRGVHYSFDIRTLAESHAEKITPATKPSTGIALPGRAVRRSDRAAGDN